MTGVQTCALPIYKPRHLLGIGEPEDFFAGVEAGADTFDCVAASRAGRNGAVYSNQGRFNIANAKYRTSFVPLVEDCDCYTCTHYTQAYVHHLVKAKELLASTLVTIHNEHFVVNLVKKIRESILDETYYGFKEEFLSSFSGRSLN